MANSQSPHTQQRIAPSTAFNVAGSPDDYRFVLRGADLVLVDQNNQEQVFMFVGNIMSLSGEVSMAFGDGQTLDARELFNRSDMEEMEQFDDEAMEWGVVDEFGNSPQPDEAEGNSSDGTGMLPPAAQNTRVPAQAEASVDPTDQLFERQRTLITKMSAEVGEGEGATQVDEGDRYSGSSGSKITGETGDTGTTIPDDDDDGTNNTPGGTDPNSPIIKLTAATDSGLQDDYTTNNQQPAFEGTALPDATVEIYIDNNLFETVTADAAGHFVSSATPAMNGGDYLLHAVQITPSGDSYQSTVHQMTIDLTAPGLPTLELSSSSNTGTVLDGNYYTNDSTPVLHGTGGDPNSTVYLEISNNGGTSYSSLAEIDMGSDGSWSYTLQNPLPDGTNYMFRLHVTDDAGNAGIGFQFLDKPLVVDTSEPVSQEPTLAAASDTMDADAGGTAGDLETKAESLDLIIDSSSDTSGIEVFLVEGASRTSLGQATKQPGGEWLFTVDHSVVPVDGDYKFIAQATDKAGNVEPVYSKTGLVVTVDRTVDNTTTIDLDSGSDSSDSTGFLGSDADNITNEDSLVITGHADGANLPVDLYVSVNGGVRQLVVNGEFTTDGFGDWSYTFDASALGLSGQDTLTFEAEICDAAGNAQPTSLNVYVDRTAPDNPVITMDGTEGADYFVHGGGVYTSENEPTFTLSNLEVGTVLNIKVDGVSMGLTTVTAASMPFTLADFAADGSEDGPHTISVEVEDTAGNASSVVVFPFTLDTGIDAVSDVKLTTASDTGESATDGITSDTTPTIQGSAEANSEVVVSLRDGGGTVVFTETVSADGFGNWQSSVTDGSLLDDGATYTVEVTSTDYAGNVATDSSYSFTLDTSIDAVDFSMVESAANDTGVANDDQYTSNPNPEFTWTAQEDLTATISVYDSGNTLLHSYTVNSPDGVNTWAIPDALGDGTYTVRGTFVDTAGNTVLTDGAGNPVTEEVSLTIDGSIATPTFELVSDTGRESDDGVTNATDLIFSGSSDVGDTVTVYRGTTVVGTFVATTANWTYTVPQGQAPEGTFDFHVTTEDTAGNTASSTPVQVEIDRSFNTPGALDLADGSDSAYTDGAFTGGTSNSDDTTNATTLTITGQVAAGGVEADSVVNLYIQGVTDPVGTVTAGAEGTTWSITVPNSAIPANGDYDFYVKYVDLAGNESGPSSDLTVSIDRTAPDDPVITMDGTAGSDYFVHGGDVYTSDNEPTFTLTDLEVGTTLNIKVDGVSVQTPTVTADTMPFTLADFAGDGSEDGLHTVSVVAVDAAGNHSSVVEYTFNLDTSAEVVSDVKLTTASDTGESATDGITYDTTPTIQGSAEANSEVVVSLRDGGGTVVFTETVTADASGDWTSSITDGSLLDDGATYTVEVSATDYAGNVATDNSYSFTLDTSIDTVDFSMVESAANDTGVADDDQYTSNPNPEFSWTAQENLTATISVYNSGNVLLHAYTVDSPNGVNTWAIPDALGDGDYTVRATFVDAAGNTVLTDGAGNPVTEEVSLTIDGSIATPTFELVSDTGRESDDGVTNATDLIFNGTSDVGDTVTVYRGTTVIDTFVATTANWTYTVDQADAPEGTFNFHVATEDAAGNTASSTPVQVEIDRSFNTPGVLDLADGSDSSYVDGAFTGGTSDSDDTTNATTLTITGQVAAGGVEADSVVNLYIQGVTDPVGTVTAGAEGTTWSITVPNSAIPANGDYDFYVRYVDLAGNESGPSSDLTVSIDRTVPDDPIITMDGTAGSDYFVHGGDVYTSDNEPTFTLTDLEVGTTLNIKVDGVSVQTPTVTADTMPFTLADFAGDGTDDGLHTISVVAVDAAGNASSVVEYTFTLDTDADGVSGVKLATASDTGESATDGITYDTTPTIVGLAEANSEVVVVLRDGGGTAVFTETVTADGAGSWEANVLNGSLLVDGSTYTVEVTATDLAGNVSTDSSYSFTLDTSIDAVSFAMVEEAANDTGFELDDQYTRNPNPEFTWTAQENLTVTISIYDETDTLVNSYTEASPAGVNTWTVPGGDPLDDGTYTIRATFTDTAGNTVLTDGVGNPVTEEVTVTVDTDAPALSVELAAASDSGVQDDWITNDEMVAAGLNLSGTAEAGSRLFVYVNDMANPVQQGGQDYLTVDASGNWTFDLSALDIGFGINNGDNAIKVIAQDKAGNTTTFTQTLEVDSEVIPVGNIFLDDASDSGTKGDFTTNDMTPTVTGTTEGGATVELSVDGGAVLATVVADADGNWSWTVPAGVLTTDDSYTFTASITDDAGNTATTSRVITIDTDLPAPDIIMAADTHGTFNGTDVDFITSDDTPHFIIDTEVGTKLEIYRDNVLVHTVLAADNMSNGVQNFTESALAGDTYTYRFVSTDGAGNTSETTQEVTIDPQYDAADLTIALHSDYDTGVSDSDGLTNEARPVFSGTAEAGSKIRVYFSDKYDTEAEANAAAVGADYETELTLAPGQSDWEYTSSLLTEDGFYKVTVVSEDAAGNQQTKTTVMELDTEAPIDPTFALTDAGDDNTIDSPTQTTDNTPGFAGTGEPESIVSITVKALGSDNAALVAEVEVDASGNWFYQVENSESLADGSYNVIVTSTDEAGNVAETTSGFVITGDVPVAPTISLDSADDSNIDTDGVTNVDTGLTLTGIAQSYSNVRLYITNASDTDCDEGTLLKTVEAGSNGVWSADLDGSLADGTYHYYVRSEYSPGDEYVSELYTLDVDTQTLTPTLALADDTGVADEWLTPAPNTTGSDWESSDATITGVVDEGATVVITATNTATSAVTTVTIDPVNLTKLGDDWIYNYDLSGLGDGEFDVQVTTTDLAGNTASSAVQTMVFDSVTTKPTIELPEAQETELSIGTSGEILLANGSQAFRALESHLPADFVSSMADGYTQTNDLHLSGLAEPGSLVRITILKDSVPFDTAPIFVSPSPSGEWVYDTGVLDDGMYTFEVTSTDLAGNEMSGDSLNVYVDAQATRSPAIALHDNIDYTNDTNDTTPTFTLYGDSDSVWLLYLDDQAAPVATGTFGVGSYTYITPGVTAGVPLLDANVEHSYTLVTVDRAGNVAVSNQFDFEIDTIAPVQQADPVDVTGTSTVVPANGGDPMEIYTNDDNPTITIKVEVGTQARMVGFGHDEWVADTDNDGLITFTVPGGSVVEQGTHSVTVEFRDSVHNHDADENLEFDLVVDTKRPATDIELQQDSDRGFLNSDGITSGDQLVLSGTILELGPGQDAGDLTTDITDYSVTVTNSTTGLSQVFDSDDLAVNADGSWELTYGVDGTPLDSGNYVATVTATDMAGNSHSSSASFVVDNEVLDDPAPSLMALGSTGYYLLQQAEYLPDTVDHSNYKYEMTFYGKDDDGNDISLSLGERSFNGDGGIEEVINPSVHDTYEYVGIKVIDYAGNESDPVFTDIDTGDVSFHTEVETAASVSTVEVSIYQDTDNDGVGDTVVDSGVAAVDGDGHWSWDFAGTLGNGDYTLHFEGFDAGGQSVSSGEESTYDFTVLATELTSDEQDFSAGEADMGDSCGGGGGGGGGGSTVEIDATVDVDHVEGNIA